MLKRKLVEWFRFVGRLGNGIWRQMVASDVPMLAGSLAFTTVISLVPLLAVSLSVFSAYGGMDSLLKKLEPFILQNLVEASGAELSRGFRRAIQRVHSGTLGVSGAAFLFLASTKLFHDTEKAVHRVWQLESKRWFVQKLVTYWTVMFLGPFFLAVVLGFMSSKDLGTIKYFSKGSTIVGIVFLSLLGIYKFVPSCRVRWSSAIYSAAIATVGFRTAQLFYQQTTRNILSYNKIYGSLASIPIFLLWVLVLWWICLMGVAICAALDKEKDQREADRASELEARAANEANEQEPLVPTEIAE